MRKVADMEDEEVLRRFGKNLNDILRRKGWTRQNLADSSGLTEYSIYRYVSGRYLPTGYGLLCLCRALDVSSSELLGF